MKLTSEQESLLAGKSGEALALAMKTMVEYGKAFDASRLVPIKSAHVAGTLGAFPYKAYYRVLDSLLADGARVKVPTTLNPRPGHTLNPLNRLLFSRQTKIDHAMRELGVTPNYSCVCYEGANVPEKGDVVGWAESSAVQYANSVLGARTNRNSVLLDVCTAVTGYTPEFGYLLDENRRGRILVKLEINRMDASALGFIIGKKAVDRVPVLEHYEFSRVELKNLGGAMAASGAVAMFHVEGLTPEAPDLKSTFDGEPEETLIVTQKDLDELRAGDPDNADLVVFGCPQMTFEEASAVAEAFAGRHSKKPVWFCLIPEARERFVKSRAGAEARDAGIEIYDHCPLAALTVRLGRKYVLTTSGKLFTYLSGSHYGSMEDCLRVCGVRS